MKNVVKRIYGGVFTLVLSLAMVMGILAGTGMEARAEGEYNFVYFELPSNQEGLNTLSSQWDVFSGEEKIRFENFMQNSSAEGSVFLIRVQTIGGVLLLCWDGNTNSWGNSGQSALINDIPSSSGSNPYSYYAVNRAGTPTTPSEIKSGASHTHSYSWVTVQEVTAEQDGIEEYRCSCGDVQARSLIPANMVFVKGLYGEIKDAPQGGTATFDSGRLYTISDYVIRKLAERTDVTTVITFEYQNQSYQMTIPAGADYTALLADQEYFYGYFYFANAVGATIEAL